MKKIINVFMLAGVVFFTGCGSKKTKPAGEEDLTTIIEKMNLQEGENQVKQLDGSLNVYAKAEKGAITSYYVRDSKTGTVYDATSTEETPDQATARRRPPGGLRFCYNRVMIDGRIIDFKVICSGQVLRR